MLLENDRGYCPWCKQGSAFEMKREVHYATPKYGGTYTFSQDLEGPTRTGVLFYECLHCEKAIVLLEHSVRLPSQEPGGEPLVKTWRVMASPAESARTLHESAPEEVRSLYAEASTCEKARAFRAAGVMYRAAVEEIVKEQGATGAQLWHKIESLKGKLSDELVEDLHEARMLGNDSIHAGLTYSAEEVEDVAKLIEEAVLVLYVQPEEKRAMREARKARRDAAKP